MGRSATAALVVALAQVAWPCEEIAVLSHDAKYMVMDGKTLDPIEVGNLRWTGVWGVDVVLPGSAATRVAFVSDRLSGALAAQAPRDRSEESALVVVANLMEADNTAMRVSFSREYPIGSGDAWWIDGTDELLVWQERQSTFTVLDSRLSVLDEWPVPDGVSTPIMSCRDRDRLYVGARRHRVVRHGDGTVVEALGKADGVEGDCYMEPVSLGCRATVGCGLGDAYEKVILDVASNRAVSKMRFDNAVRNRSGERDASDGTRTVMRSIALFAGGRKLLRQSEIGTPYPPGSSHSYRTRPGATLRALDTVTSGTVVENYDAPPGTASRVFCEGADERIVVSGQGRMHLVDLQTLEPIASAAIPFGRHFVF